MSIQKYLAKTITKTPTWIQKAFPQLIWKYPTTEKKLFLTFDDGPIPIVTEWVLEELAKYEVKATFFCVGHNVEKHPRVYQKILQAGHQVGNHTYHHLNAWKTPVVDYVKNIALCQKKVASPLFRPPYGKLTPAHFKPLREKFRFIMWDVLSSDFNANLPPADCWDNVVKKTEKGSIIVFHDSLKSFATLQYVLPKLLVYYLDQGYTFEICQ